MNHKIKLLAVALAGAFSIGSAQAANYSYGDVTGGDLSGTIYLSQMGSFVDNHFFSVNTPSTGSSVLQNIQIGSMLDTFGLTVNLFMDNGSNVGVWDPLDIHYAFIGAGSSIFNTGPLMASNYFFQVVGNASGTGFNLDGAPGLEYGAYFFQASAAPVPEPETWAMLLAGLGLVGLQLRRRNNAGKIAIN